MAYALHPGRYKLELRFGILAGAAKAGSDGVVFRAGLGDGSGQLRYVFEHAIELQRTSPDPQLQTHTFEFETKQGARLVLETDPGPRRASTCDWAFWRDVRLDRLGDPR